jgi:hypothetical protein
MIIKLQLKCNVFWFYFAASNSFFIYHETVQNYIKPLSNFDLQMAIELLHI